MSEPNTSSFHVEKTKADFPVLHQQINDAPLVYLDNGASTQKPQCVLDSIMYFYQKDYANVHRGIHTLSQRATDSFENARRVAQHFINARSENEIIFTRGTTESINLVAHSLIGAQCQAGDEVIISTLEHHSNIVPWQMLEKTMGIHIKVIPINDDGEIIFEEYLKLLSNKTKLVAITQLSNALGTITPLHDIIQEAKKVGANTLVDGAQAIAHLPVDVQALGCDFYAFSSHKLYGPTGIGVLYGKSDLLEAMPPYQGGGEMIKEVSFKHTQYNDIPHKFEAGTPNIAAAIGMATAMEYLRKIGMSNIAQYELELTQYATEKLLTIKDLRLVGTAQQKSSILSFFIEGTHASDIGTLLDQLGIAIRVGHHCAMPLMQRFGLSSTARASIAMYNTKDDIDRLHHALNRVASMLR